MDDIDLTSESIAYARELRALHRSAEQRAVRFRLLVEMGRDLVNARDLQALLRLALVRATTFSGYDWGYVFLRNGDGKLVERASLGENMHTLPASQSQLNADIQHVLQMVTPLIIPQAPESTGYQWPSRVYLPLIPSDGQPLGVLLLLSNSNIRPPDHDDLDALQLLASQLAAAIQSAQHHEDKGRLVAQLTEREQRLEELVDRLIGAQEEERRRIAYEVHDGLGQMMLGALQQLHTLADLYRPRSPRSRLALGRAIDMVQASVSEARRVIAGLRPTALDDLGLATALRIQISALQAEGWDLHYEEALGNTRLTPALETTLFRICQEALSNVRKHAGTTSVTVSIRRISSQIELTVHDKGRGFSSELLAGPAEPGTRVGLLGMQERVNLLGGQLKIESQPGAGTRVWVSLPLPPAEATESSYEQCGNKSP